MSYAVNCPGTRGCTHMKSLSASMCSKKGCTEKTRLQRSHVHIDGSCKTSLIMFCATCNNPNNRDKNSLKVRTAIVNIPSCDCCTCGCNSIGDYSSRGCTVL